MYTIRIVLAGRHKEVRIVLQGNVKDKNATSPMPRTLVFHTSYHELSRSRAEREKYVCLLYIVCVPLPVFYKTNGIAPLRRRENLLNHLQV